MMCPILWTCLNNSPSDHPFMLFFFGFHSLRFGCPFLSLFAKPPQVYMCREHKSSNYQYKLCGWISYCSIVLRSWWPSIVASPISGRLQRIRLVWRQWTFQWSQKLDCLSPPWQLIATSFSDYHRGKSHWARCRDYRQDASLWWRWLPRGLLKNALDCGDVPCPDALSNISISFIVFWAKVYLQIGNSNIAEECWIVIFSFQHREVHPITFLHKITFT
jgi:hypothetical protein